MKTCPRCHRQTNLDDNSHNFLSHRDSKTNICFNCFDEEIAIDKNEIPATVNELAFLRYLKVKWEVL